MRSSCWLCLPLSLAAALSAYLLPGTALPWAALAAVVLLALSLLLRGRLRSRALLLFLGAAVGFTACWIQNGLVTTPCEARAGDPALVSFG